MEDNTNLYNQRNILIRNFLIFSRLAPFITSFISSVLINNPTMFVGSRVDIYPRL